MLGSALRGKLLPRSAPWNDLGISGNGCRPLSTQCSMPIIAKGAKTKQYYDDCTRKLTGGNIIIGFFFIVKRRKLATVFVCCLLWSQFMVEDLHFTVLWFSRLQDHSSQFSQYRHNSSRINDPLDHQFGASEHTMVAHHDPFLPSFLPFNLPFRCRHVSPGMRGFPALPRKDNHALLLICEAKAKNKGGGEYVFHCKRSMVRAEPAPTSAQVGRIIDSWKINLPPTPVFSCSEVVCGCVTFVCFFCFCYAHLYAFHSNVGLAGWPAWKVQSNKNKPNAGA